MYTCGSRWWVAIITKYDKMNRARMGLTFYAGVWNLQSLIYTRPLKLTCFITFDCGLNVNCARG